MPVAAGGGSKTIMAGLNCGEPNIYALPVLTFLAQAFFKCSDKITKTGMKRLANPLGDDPRIVSGESGAVGAGLLISLNDEEYMDFRNKISLNKDSVVLLFSTEGDTDKDNYNEITGGDLND